MADVMIGKRKVGAGNPCYIIAEIGINHNGDVNIAKKLIDLAAFAGCDAVKFQKRTIDVVYSAEELAKPRENPFGTTNGDLKYGLEFGLKEYKEINNIAGTKKSCGLPPAGTKVLLILSNSLRFPVIKSHRQV